MILHDKKLIYIHIPKTAGMSMSKTFDQKWDINNHSLISKYREAEYDDYSKFAVIRNPHSRLFSVYNYITRKHYYDNNYICGPNKEWLSFPTWLVYNLENYKGHLTHEGFNKQVKSRYEAGSSFWFSPQYYWIHEEGKLGVDKVLNFNQLNEDFDAYMGQLGFEEKLATVNKNPVSSSKYLEGYDDYTFNLVKSFYKIDFIHFNHFF